MFVLSRGSRLVAFCCFSLLLSTPFSARAEFTECADSFSYSGDADGTFLMACGVSEERYDPVDYSLSQAKEVCEDSHAWELDYIRSNVIPSWAKRCAMKNCVLSYQVMDFIDCSAGDGYAYCNCGGSLECYRADQGQLTDPPLSRKECAGEVTRAFGNGIRMVVGCEGRINGGNIYVNGSCISPDQAARNIN